MYPPVFDNVNTPAVQAQLKTGGGHLRVYPFGQAPQATETPYAVWSVRDGAPENYLGQLPDIDSVSVQMDVYANPSQGYDTLMAAAYALRDAIEPVAHITLWLANGTDPETQYLRMTFMSRWWVQR